MAKPLILILALITLVFASASGASFNRLSFRTVTEDSITCEPQKGSSDQLWNCQDYYSNQYPNLKIIQVSK